jgi:hypothetical protein
MKSKRATTFKVNFYDLVYSQILHNKTRDVLVEKTIREGNPFFR